MDVWNVLGWLRIITPIQILEFPELLKLRHTQKRSFVLRNTTLNDKKIKKIISV